MVHLVHSMCAHLYIMRSRAVYNANLPRNAPCGFPLIPIPSIRAIPAESFFRDARIRAINSCVRINCAITLVRRRTISFSQVRSTDRLAHSLRRMAGACPHFSPRIGHLVSAVAQNDARACVVAAIIKLSAHRLSQQ